MTTDDEATLERTWVHDHSDCTADAHDRWPGDTTPEEQARDANGQMLCNDCQQPIMYCRTYEAWDHVSPYAEPCWLVNR